MIPHEIIQVVVRKGWVTLSGEVEWEYQKSAATKNVTPLAGVTGVTNEIQIRPKLEVSNIKQKIEQALKRAAESEASKIQVTVDGRKITLSGKVRSYAELIDARQTAWSAPGVSEVRDNLTISPL